MTGVWEREVASLLRSQQVALKWQANTVRTRLAAAEKAMAELAKAEERLLKITSAHEKATRRLLDRRDDPEVLVRNYNKTTLYTYHADEACGWAPKRGNSEWILLSQARDDGMTACSSCGYRVPKVGSQLNQAS